MDQPDDQHLRVGLLVLHTFGVAFVRVCSRWLALDSSSSSTTCVLYNPSLPQEVCYGFMVAVVGDYCVQSEHPADGLLGFIVATVGDFELRFEFT